MQIYMFQGVGLDLIRKFGCIVSDCSVRENVFSGQTRIFPRTLASASRKYFTNGEREMGKFNNKETWFSYIIWKLNQ